MREWLKPTPLACALLALVAAVEGAYIMRARQARSLESFNNRADIGLHAQDGAVSGAAPAAASANEAGLGKRGATNAKERSAGEKNGGRGAAGVSSTGRLIVRSAPSGARVLVDGAFHGLTPLTLTRLSTGKHRVVVQSNGKRVQQSVVIEADATASVIVPFLPDAPSSGRLAFTSGVELGVFEDSTFLGTTRTPELLLSAGSHTLRLVNDTLGFAQVQEVTIEAGRLHRLNVQLPTGKLNVNAVPWAEVVIDGAVVGETPIGNLPLTIGTHEILFRHPQLGERTVSAVVTAGAPVRVSVDMRHPIQ
jgi:hypothetical protein